MKKAAMFGLDARIALAIFGALSVISGAALYSAIQQAKTVSIVAELNEAAKAIEAYMLDTGLDLVLDSTNYYYADLVDNTAARSGWNGPYIAIPGELKGTGNRLYLDHPSYGNLLFRALESNIGGANYSHPTACTTAPCYYWIQLNGLEHETVKNIDLYIDGSLDDSAGRVRYIDISTNSVFIQGPIVLNQP